MSLFSKETAFEKFERIAAENDAKALSIDAAIAICLDDDSAESRKRFLDLEAERKFIVAKAKKARIDAQAARDKAAKDECERLEKERRKLISRILKKSAERAAHVTTAAAALAQLVDANERIWALDRSIRLMAGDLLPATVRSEALLELNSHRRAIGAIMRDACASSDVSDRAGLDFKTASLYAQPSRLSPEEVFEQAHRKLEAFLNPSEADHAST